MELQLQRAQKLEAIGRLAGGVAHDFNNQLTAILGYADMVLEQIDRDKPIWPDLQEIKLAAERSAALTRQLLAFSRRQVLTIEPLDLDAVVQDVSRLLGRLLGEDIVCDLKLAGDLPLVDADSGQLAQVLSNLAVNARDAMPEGGRLTIATDRARLTEEEARQRAAMAAGEYVVLDVADTGHGMDAATQAQIFEPFFTTKEQGQGTGLGLAVVYGIVKQMGGFIWVYSEPGRGSRFRLYFPCSAERARAKPAPAPAAEPGHGTVLVVEDEAGVRELAVRALRRYGYTVLEAASAQAALDVLRERGHVDLVLLDVVLPDRSGPDLVAELEAQAPVRVLFMSGYSEHHVRHRAAARVRLLEKPFTVQDLLRHVREVLSAV
jgi:CheY-like chemotaxis protein